MALQALRLARELPGLSGDRDGLAADHPQRLGAARIPLVGVTGPHAIVVTHEEARLDQLRAQREILDEYAAVREIEIVAGGHVDALAVGQCQPARLDRTIR